MIAFHDASAMLLLDKEMSKSLDSKMARSYYQKSWKYVMVLMFRDKIIGNLSS